MPPSPLLQAAMTRSKRRTDASVYAKGVLSGITIGVVCSVLGLSCLVLVVSLRDLGDFVLGHLLDLSHRSRVPYCHLRHNTKTLYHLDVVFRPLKG